MMSGAVPQSAEESRPRSAISTRQAVLDAVEDVSGSTRRIADSLSLIEARQAGISGQANGVFTPYVAYGSQQLKWLRTALRGANQLAHAASEVDDPDMELALLRLTGPRIEAAMSGALLLSAWLDFLNLVDVVLQKYPLYSMEQLLVDTDRVHKRLYPSMTALASLDPEQVEATAGTLPGVMEQLIREFHSTQEAVRVATERGGQVILAAQLVEMLIMAPTMKLTLPRLPPAAPALLGVGLMVGTDGVMMGTQVVVSAEWVEMMRRLVQAGVISLPAVSATVRIHAGQVMMSQRHDALPQSVRDALGEGPEVRGMHETGKAGAGMAQPPRHHVLPREHRKWFEQRGFTGEMSIDQFCVRMEQAHHEALHGGGGWLLGRQWPGEWNRMIMKVLRDAETEAGRMLTRNEILTLVARTMRNHKIPMLFTPWRGR